MSPPEELESAVLALPRAERARLAQQLLASLDEEPEVEAAWRDEVRRRLEAYRTGVEATVGREAVIREAKRRYGA
jgi:putative addiction module component (TIGR02574 family)